MTDHLAAADSLIGQLQRGRGRSFQELASLNQSDAQAAVQECVSTLERPTEMVTHVHGYADAVASLRICMSDWYTWIAELPEVAADGSASPRERMMFVATLLGELVKRDVSGSWPCLQTCLSKSDNWRTILSYTYQLLPDDVFMRLLPQVSNDALSAMYDVQDARWYRLAKMSERVRYAIPGFDACIGTSIQEYTDQKYSLARLSQSRFALVRYAVTLSLTCAEDLLFEGLWDANLRARLMSTELIDLEYPGARSRLDHLRKPKASPIALAAARRLRSLDEDCWVN